jgi:hypothetical protein
MVANTTFFLDKPAGAALTSEVRQEQKTIDFSKHNVIENDTLHALRVPAGAIVWFLWVRIDTANTVTAATLAASLVTNTSGPTTTALAMLTPGTMQISDSDATLTKMYCSAADYVKVTVASGAATTGIATIGMIYSIPAAASAI